MTMDMQMDKVIFTLIIILHNLIEILQTCLSSITHSNVHLLCTLSKTIHNVPTHMHKLLLKAMKLQT
jgi:zinc transporter ZupT